MASAVHQQVSVLLGDGSGSVARAGCSRVVRAGFEAVLRPAKSSSAVSKAGDNESKIASELPASTGSEAPSAPELEEGTVDIRKLDKKDQLNLLDVLPSQHFTAPPGRYSEGSLVRKLEELGVGRPSTYATIMRVLQERGYAHIVSKAFRPLERGQLLTALLVGQLEEVVQYEYTAQLEEELDLISAGKLEARAFLSRWWKRFEPAVTQVQAHDTQALRDQVADKLAWQLFPNVPVSRPADASEHPSSPNTASAPLLAPERRCPTCSDGELKVKFSKGRAFLGCSSYPNCSFTRPLLAAAATDDEGRPVARCNRVLGLLDGLEVSVRTGPFGGYVQLGGNLTHDELHPGSQPDVAKMKVAQLREELKRRGMPGVGRKAELVQSLLRAPDLMHVVPQKRVALLSNMAAINATFAEAKSLLQLPKVICAHPVSGANISLLVGRFGPFLKLDETRDAKAVICSVPANMSLWTVGADDAIRLVDRKAKRLGSTTGRRDKGVSES